MNHRATLLWIAGEYRNWPLASDMMYWSPYLCSSPPTNVIQATRSTDDDTHGRKLYFLYARDGAAYIAGTSPENDSRGPGQAGQMLVKEAWHPLPVAGITTDDAGTVTQWPQGIDWSNVSSMGDQWYTRGPQADLFIMYRLPADTPGTDRGWVYGVVRPTGPLAPNVIASGMIGSCIECHSRAPYAGLFGLHGRGAAADPAPGE